MQQLLHLSVLASGSSGNAAVVEGPEGSILIDCGISYRQMRERADEVGCNLDRIGAVFVTHEHSDHVSGLSVIANKFDVPFFSTVGTVSGKSYLSQIPFTLIDHDMTLDVCGMTVESFPTSHDVADPMGFRFALYSEMEEDGSGGDLLDAIGWMTDTGYVTDAALDGLYGVRILGIESNHDVEMLKNGPYPAYLKKRILSPFGHLSNDQCAEVLPALVTRDTEAVVALHLSEENNRPAVCVRTLAAAVGAEVNPLNWCEASTDDGRLWIAAASQDEPMRVW
jgi:phosphoribosyl 1,2-cyclic phosphodiesterase